MWSDARERQGLVTIREGTAQNGGAKERRSTVMQRNGLVKQREATEERGAALTRKGKALN